MGHGLEVAAGRMDLCLRHLDHVVNIFCGDLGSGQDPVWRRFLDGRKLTNFSFFKREIKLLYF